MGGYITGVILLVSKLFLPLLLRKGLISIDE